MLHSGVKSCRGKTVAYRAECKDRHRPSLRACTRVNDVRSALMMCWQDDDRGSKEIVRRYLPRRRVFEKWVLRANSAHPLRSHMAGAQTPHEADECAGCQGARGREAWAALTAGGCGFRRAIPRRQRESVTRNNVRARR